MSTIRNSLNITERATRSTGLLLHGQTKGRRLRIGACSRKFAPSCKRPTRWSLALRHLWLSSTDSIIGSGPSRHHTSHHLAAVFSLPTPFASIMTPSQICGMSLHVLPSCLSRSASIIVSMQACPLGAFYYMRFAAPVVHHRLSFVHRCLSCCDSVFLFF